MGWPKSRAASKLDKEIAALSKKLEAFTKTPSAKAEGKGKGKGDQGPPNKKVAWYCQHCGADHRNDNLQTCRVCTASRDHGQLELIKQMQAQIDKLTAASAAAPSQDAPATVAWYCQKCGTDHSKEALTKCRKCRHPKAPPLQPPPPTVAQTGSVVSQVANSSQSSSSPSSPSPLQKDHLMAKNKPLLISLKRVGLNVDGQEVDIEMEDVTSATEMATTKVAKIQSMIDTMTELDSDANVLKELRKELDAAKKQTGSTAQSKTIKDLAAAEYQLNLHLDAVDREQKKVLQAHDSTLDTLRKAVQEHESMMARQKQLDQEVMDYIKALKAQTSAMIKHASAVEARAEVAQPAAVQPPQQVSLAPELAVMADALKSMLQQINGATLPANSGEQQVALEQLRTKMTTTLQPILGTMPIAASGYGPAITPGHAHRQETAPYASESANAGGTRTPD